ncbi:hypothetical protein C8F01DRAFT_161858 [Mycena amicta]|nr:hypothetical protein C8F01DRAFT_161858 [Mycena amicta]
MVSWGLSRSIDRVALIPGCRCISWTFARLIRLPLGSSGRRYISSSFALGISSSALLFPGVARLSRVCPRFTPFPCPAGRTLLHLFPCACSNPAASSFMSGTFLVNGTVSVRRHIAGATFAVLVGEMGLYPGRHIRGRMSYTCYSSRLAIRGVGSFVLIQR